MVSQSAVTKPSRSDELLDADQQLKIANQVKAQFDSLAPKRPTKPNRSEPDPISSSDNPSAVDSSTDQIIPELDKLRSLKSQSHVLYSGEGENLVGDEFVETQYYKELVSIDKQHHTTGTGFIRAAKEGGEDNVYNIQLGGGYGGGNRPVFKSNPATNDWVPNVEEDDQVQARLSLTRASAC